MLYIIGFIYILTVLIWFLGYKAIITDPLLNKDIIIEAIKAVKKQLPNISDTRALQIFHGIYFFLALFPGINIALLTYSYVQAFKD